MGSRELQSDAVLGRIGRYTVLAELARGGMSQVLIAQRDGSPDLCVLKQLLGELKTHQLAERRFFREAQLAAYLDHPRIARVLDAGFEDDTFCIAMEYIAGCNVEELVRVAARRGRMLPYQISLAVALGALEGLEYAHDALAPSGEPLELIHRDLSPRNLMLSFAGEVKIIDFGVARGRVDDFRTDPGMIVGTLRYVSPEQAVAEPLDRRSDLYSLAVVLYELLTGRPMIPDGSPIEVLSDVLHRPARPLTAVNPELPRALEHVLARALAKTPADRYPDARTFRLDLEAAASEVGRTTAAAIGDFAAAELPAARDAARVLKLRARRRHATRSSDVSAAAMHTLTPPAPQAPSPLELLVPAARELRADEESRPTLRPPRGARAPEPAPDITLPPNTPEALGGDALADLPGSFTAHGDWPGAGDFDDTRLADLGLTPTEDQVPTAVDRRRAREALPPEWSQDGSRGRPSRTAPVHPRHGDVAGDSFTGPESPAPTRPADDTLVGPLSSLTVAQGAVATQLMAARRDADAGGQAVTLVSGPPKPRAPVVYGVGRSALIVLAIGGALVGLTWAASSWTDERQRQAAVASTPPVRATPLPPTATGPAGDLVPAPDPVVSAAPPASAVSGTPRAPRTAAEAERAADEPSRAERARDQAPASARTKLTRAERRRAAQRAKARALSAETEDEAGPDPSPEPPRTAEPAPAPADAAAMRARLETLIERASAMRSAHPEHAPALEEMIANASVWLTASDANRLEAAADQLESRLAAVTRR